VKPFAVLLRGFAGLAWAAVVATPVAGCRTAQLPRHDSAEVEAYFEAKARYTTTAHSRLPANHTWNSYNAEALKDLEARLRRIVGPVSIAGRAPTFSLSSLPGDLIAGDLDGLAITIPEAQTRVIVTTPAVLSGWIREQRRTAAGSDPFSALDDDMLTWAFPTGAHVNPYVDVRARAALPRDIVLAQLIHHAQDVFRVAPDELIVGVHRDGLFSLILAPAPRLAVPAECEKALDEAIKASGRFFDDEHRVFVSCFDRVVTKQPEFQQVVARVRELAASMAGKRVR
jgi:hypothetical protein